MIGKLNHIAIAVPDLAAAAILYRETFGAKVSAVIDLPEHGVSTVFVTLTNTKIELIHPLGDDSQLAAFLARNPAGGMHHICYSVNDIDSACEQLIGQGLRILGAEASKSRTQIGAHGKQVIFLHPKDTLGALVELEQV